MLLTASSTVLKAGSSKNIIWVNRANFNARHGNEKAEDIRQQSTLIADLLRQRQNSSRYVMHPDTNKWIGYWDVLTSIALVWTVSLRPTNPCHRHAQRGPAFSLARLLVDS